MEENQRRETFESTMPHDPDEDMYLEGKHWTQAFLLGTGAFSKCYQARDVRTGTLMAVKQTQLNRDGNYSEKVCIVMGLGPFYRRACHLVWASETHFKNWPSNTDILCIPQKELLFNA